MHCLGETSGAAHVESAVGNVIAGGIGQVTNSSPKTRMPAML